MTTIDQQAALLRAICQRPDDTQARLVYADWCEDNGQEARAEFVRLQVELSSLPPALPEIEGHIVEWNAHTGQPVNFAVVIRRKDAPPGPFVIRHQQRDDSWFESSPALIQSVEEYDPDRVKARCVFHERDTADWQRSQVLRRRERELLGPNWTFHEWSGGVIPGHFCDNLNQAMYPGTPTPTPYVVFRNGFVESIITTSTMWFAHGPQIVAATPVRTVRLTDKRPWRLTNPLQFCWISDRGAKLPNREPHTIPHVLFEIMETRKHYLSVHYPSEQAALDALSAAAVAWARRQAGL